GAPPRRRRGGRDPRRGSWRTLQGRGLFDLLHRVGDGAGTTREPERLSGRPGVFPEGRGAGGARRRAAARAQAPPHDERGAFGRVVGPAERRADTVTGQAEHALIRPPRCAGSPPFRSSFPPDACGTAGPMGWPVGSRRVPRYAASGCMQVATIRSRPVLDSGRRDIPNRLRRPEVRPILRRPGFAPGRESLRPAPSGRNRPAGWPGPSPRSPAETRRGSLMVVGKPVAVRPPISESWRRSRDAGVDAGVAAAPLAFDLDVLADARGAHPLRRHVPTLNGLLRRVADETGHLLVISDEAGHVLWTHGPPATRRAAERIGLSEGFRWSEDAVGTNGIGTALASGRPEQLYASEHVARILHRWSCAGAPLTDPDTGRVIGCIDVSATVCSLHPATVALVSTAARLAESRLENEMRERDERLRERLLPHLRGRRDAGLLVSA